MEHFARPHKPFEKTIKTEPVRKPAKLKEDDGKLEIYTTLLKPDAWLSHECILGVSFCKRLIPVATASGRGYSADKVPTALLTEKQKKQIENRAKEHFHTFQKDGVLHMKCVADEIVMMKIDEYLEQKKAEFAVQTEKIYAEYGVKGK